MSAHLIGLHVPAGGPDRATLHAVCTTYTIFIVHGADILHTF